MTPDEISQHIAIAYADRRREEESERLAPSYMELTESLAVRNGYEMGKAVVKIDIYEDITQDWLAREPAIKLRDYLSKWLEEHDEAA
jgi:hypothetical protein